MVKISRINYFDTRLALYEVFIEMFIIGSFFYQKITHEVFLCSLAEEVLMTQRKKE